MDACGSALPQVWFGNEDLIVNQLLCCPVNANPCFIHYVSSDKLLPDVPLRLDAKPSVWVLLVGVPTSSPHTSDSLECWKSVTVMQINIKFIVLIM